MVEIFVGLRRICRVSAPSTVLDLFVLLLNSLLHSVDLESLEESHCTETHHHQHLGSIIAIKVVVHNLLFLDEKYQFIAKLMNGILEN